MVYKVILYYSLTVVVLKAVERHNKDWWGQENLHHVEEFFLLKIISSLSLLC